MAPKKRPYDSAKAEPKPVLQRTPKLDLRDDYLSIGERAHICMHNLINEDKKSC